AVCGELDSASCGELDEAFDRQLDGQGLEKLVLDLGGMTFVDSAGIRTLILLERRAGRAGVPLEVVPAPQEGTHLLRLSGLAGRMNFVPTQPAIAEPDEFLERIDTELQREPTAPAQARADVRLLLGPRVRESELATLVLLTSELVTNAVIH